MTRRWQPRPRRVSGVWDLVLLTVVYLLIFSPVIVAVVLAILGRRV